jgi:phosphoribosylformylglycinamidine cyclo-ligase
VIPADLAVDVERSTWAPLAIFDVLATRGGIQQVEMERTFNMGVGMIAVLAAHDADAGCRRLAEMGIDAWVCGSVRQRVDGETGDAEAKGGDGGAVLLRGRYQP